MEGIRALASSIRPPRRARRVQCTPGPLRRPSRRRRPFDRPAGSAIGFGLGRHLDRARREVRYDVLFRLEENRWNGTVAPQLVVRDLHETPERYESLRAWLADEFRKEARSPEAQAIFDEL